MAQKLYVSNKENNAEILSSNILQNISEDPYYVLIGLIVPENKEEVFKDFLKVLKKKYSKQWSELKIQDLSNNLFIKELINYISENKFSVFIEFIDKQYYLNLQFTKYFVFLFDSFSSYIDTSEEYVTKVSEVGKLLSPEIYESFVDTINSYSNSSLEKFYDKLIIHFHNINRYDYEEIIKMNKKSYFTAKLVNIKKALKLHLPVPNETELSHLLPNNNAFQNFIGKIQKYKDEALIDGIKIFYDEKTSFDKMYKKALNLKCKDNYKRKYENLFFYYKEEFTFDDEIQFETVNSKDYVFVEVANLLSEVIIKCWSDFKNNKSKSVSKNLSVIDKLLFPENKITQSSNLVVSLDEYYDFYEIDTSLFF